jgi:hypothetical protein
MMRAEESLTERHSVKSSIYVLKSEMLDYVSEDEASTPSSAPPRRGGRF